MEGLGIAVFAVGILISVCLHEAGHMVTAKMFGMKVTRYFVGFGPTLWSTRKGETEYGVKAIPAGGFVKIVGMTPQDEDVEPADEPRAMWRFPVWKRTIVMVAGSVTHFALGIVILWALFAFVALPDGRKLQTTPITIDTVTSCVTLNWELDPTTHQVRECRAGTDPQSAAQTAGLRSGDVVTAIDGQSVVGWDALTSRIRSAAGRQISITYERDGQSHTATAMLPTAQRPRQGLDPTTPTDKITAADLENVGVLGITPSAPTTTAGPIAAIGLTADRGSALFSGTFTALKKFPEKVPKLWSALTGDRRDPETPVSVVGASRIGGELFGQGDVPGFLFLLASLNIFVGIFNLLPLLPLDGGHIAIAWFEKARTWLYARLRRPDPGRVNYLKLMPVTYAVILVFGGFTLLTVAADIINPITLFSK